MKKPKLPLGVLFARGIWKLGKAISALGLWFMRTSSKLYDIEIAKLSKEIADLKASRL